MSIYEKSNGRGWRRRPTIRIWIERQAKWTIAPFAKSIHFGIFLLGRWESWLYEYIIEVKQNELLLTLLYQFINEIYAIPLVNYVQN